MIELVGMVSMDEEGNGVISFESMQLTKWGLISAWSNLALVTSTHLPRKSAQQLQIFHSHYQLLASLNSSGKL